MYFSHTLLCYQNLFGMKYDSYEKNVLFFKQYSIMLINIFCLRKLMDAKSLNITNVRKLVSDVDINSIYKIKYVKNKFYQGHFDF